MPPEPNCIRSVDVLLADCVTDDSVPLSVVVLVDNPAPSCICNGAEHEDLLEQYDIVVVDMLMA